MSAICWLRFAPLPVGFTIDGAAKGGKDAPVLSNGESCFAVVDTIPIGCEAHFLETLIRYVDTLPLTSFREHELVHPLRRSVPARGDADGGAWPSVRCAFLPGGHAHRVRRGSVEL